LIDCLIASDFGIFLQQYADDPRYTFLCLLTIWLLLLAFWGYVLELRPHSTLHSWLCHNGLALNINKSETILLGTSARSAIWFYSNRN